MYTPNIAPVRQLILPNFSHQACRLASRLLYRTEIKKHYFLRAQIHFFDWHGIGQQNSLYFWAKKMSDFLLIGTLFGLVVSFFHAVYMYGLVVSGANSTVTGSKLSAFNFSLWTCALWILMGAYLLGFWLISLVFYIVFKAFR